MRPGVICEPRRYFIVTAFSVLAFKVRSPRKLPIKVRVGDESDGKIFCPKALWAPSVKILNSFYLPLTFCSAYTLLHHSGRCPLA